MEKIDIYNKKREKTGIVKEKDALEKGEYRILVYIWIIDQNSKLLIQKRALTEKRFPGKWALTGGGVLAGESALETVKRETKEELSLEVYEDEISYIGSYIRKKDFVDIWLIEKEINIANLKLQEEEVEDVKLVTFDEFENMIEIGEVVHSVNPSYLLLKNYYNSYKQ